MGRVYRQPYTVPDGNGGRKRKLSKKWYIEYTDADGKQHREPVSADKSIAQAALTKKEAEVARAKHGIADPVAGAASRDAAPVAGLVAEYLAELTHRERAERYIEEVTRHLKAVSGACKWHTWADVRHEPVAKFLTALRSGKKRVSPATANGYVRSVKGFAAWHADRIEVLSPLRNIKLFNEQVDRRRSRRILDDAEFEKLVAATEAAPPRHNAEFTGRERAAIYRVARYTGFRLSEIATLTPSHFHLDAEVPFVTVAAGDTKGKREEPIPLAEELLAFLRVWLADKPRTKLLWPGRWAEDRRQVNWLKRDAGRAELGDGVIFSSLRRKYVTALIRAGNDIDVVRRLARHRSAKTTLDHYAEANMADLKRGVDKKPPEKPKKAKGEPKKPDAEG